MANFSQIITDVVVPEFLEAWRTSELDWVSIARDYSRRVRAGGNTITTGTINLLYDGTDSGSDADNRIQVRDNQPYGEFEYDKVDPGSTNFVMNRRKVVAIEYDMDLLDSAFVDPVINGTRAEAEALRMSMNKDIRDNYIAKAANVDASQRSLTSMTAANWNSADAASMKKLLTDLARMRKRMRLKGAQRPFLAMHPWMRFKIEEFVINNGDYGTGIFQDQFLRTGEDGISVGWDIVEDPGLSDTNNPETGAAGVGLYKMYAGRRNESVSWAQRQIQALVPIDLRPAKKLGFGIVGAFRFGSACLEDTKVWSHSITLT